MSCCATPTPARLRRAPARLPTARLISRRPVNRPVPASLSYGWSARPMGASFWPSPVPRHPNRPRTINVSTGTESLRHRSARPNSSETPIKRVHRHEFRRSHPAQLFVHLKPFLSPLKAIPREAMHVPTAPRVISNGITRAKLTSALHTGGVSGRLTGNPMRGRPIQSLVWISL